MSTTIQKTTIKDATGNEFEATYSLAHVNGRLEVTGFSIQAQSSNAILTQQLLRSIYLTDAKRKARVGEEEAEAGDLAPITLHAWTASDEQLTLIAALYREAYATGKPVQRYIANKLGRPESSVNRWVGIARKKGFLGASNSTRGGEV